MRKTQYFLLYLQTIYFLRSCLSYDIYNDVYYPGQSGTLLESDDYFDQIPQIHKQYRFRERNTGFTGHYNGSFYTSYENRRQVFQFEKSSFLSWETVTTRSGRRVATYIKLDGRNVNSKTKYDVRSNHKQHKNTHRSKRRRREVFGRDDRTEIPVNKNFGLREPYIYTVKLSTGCTGIVISPRHVLTAAHCVHDQRDYLSKTKDLKAGFASDDGNFEWISVKSIKVSKGWIEGGAENGPFFDYALLKLGRKHHRPYIRLSISEKEKHGIGERISFSGFDDDKPTNTMWYRSCSVIEDDPSFLYHYCDAKPGSSGSGVYSWIYDENAHEWTRALVGVFSGNRWRRYDEFFVIVRNFNVAVRLTASRYAQICKWLGKAADVACHNNRQNKH